MISNQAFALAELADGILKNSPAADMLKHRRLSRLLPRHDDPEALSGHEAAVATETAARKLLATDFGRPRRRVPPLSIIVVAPICPGEDDMTRAADREIAEAIAAGGTTTASRLGLRFDRVAIRILEHLKIFAEANAPEDRTVLLTLTAPIRSPKIVIAALEQEITKILCSSHDNHRKIEINDNHTEIYIVARASPRRPKLLGFVHNPDVDAALILKLAEQWLRSDG